MPEVGQESRLGSLLLSDAGAQSRMKKIPILGGPVSMGSRGPKSGGKSQTRDVGEEFVQPDARGRVRQVCGKQIAAAWVPRPFKDREPLRPNRLGPAVNHRGPEPSRRTSRQSASSGSALWGAAYRGSLRLHCRLEVNRIVLNGTELQPVFPGGRPSAPRFRERVGAAACASPQCAALARLLQACSLFSKNNFPKKLARVQV